MDTEKIMQECDEHILRIYNRYRIVLDHGEGVCLYDTEGKRYLDFQAGIAVCGLGYSDERYKNALISQIGSLMHTSNLYYSETCAGAAGKLSKAAGLDRVFFTNSGTEAIEGLIKVARKYAWKKDGGHDHEIIAFEHSFHGRSMGAISVTGNEHYREPFEPLIGNVRFAEYNNIESVKSLVNPKTCAILLETVQGEGGVYPADPEFLREIRRICDENDILMMLDEIQCGMGRCGNYFAWQSYGEVKPDCMAVAKAIGNGMPVGAFLLNEKVAGASLEPGDHGSTYGGNPLACAAVSAVFDIFEEDNIISHVQEITPYFESALEDLIQKHSDRIVSRRGRGLIQGLVMKTPVSEVISKCQEKGLLVISAEGNVLRLLPPLVIEKRHIDEMKDILDEVLR